MEESFFAAVVIWYVYCKGSNVLYLFNSDGTVLVLWNTMYCICEVLACLLQYEIKYVIYNNTCAT